MSQTIRNLFISSLILLMALTGCITVQRLPAYDIAMSLPGPDRPKLFYDNTVKLNSALTPYAVLNSQGYAREIWEKAAELKADVVLIKTGNTQYTGSVGTAMPLGYGGAIAVALPMYQTTIYGYCYRLNPARMGLGLDQNLMVIELNNDLKEAGILEGDKLISMNGVGYDPVMPERLNFKPGDEVILTVIRPGTGRINIKAKMMENPPTYLDYADAIPWEAPEIKQTEPEDYNAPLK